MLSRRRGSGSSGSRRGRRRIIREERNRRRGERDRVRKRNIIISDSLIKFRELLRTRVLKVALVGFHEFVERSEIPILDTEAFGSSFDAYVARAHDGKCKRGQSWIGGTEPD